MSKQEHPNEEQPEAAPSQELQPPQPTPPVYGPPPVQAQPGLQPQPPQYAAPQYGQAPPQQPNAPQQHVVPPQNVAPQQPGVEQAPQAPGGGQYQQAPQPPGGVQYPQQADPAQYPTQQYPAQQFPEQQYPEQQYPGQEFPGQQYAAGQQQYAAGIAPVAPAPRKGLPVGAWIGIGAGALVLLLLIVTGIVIAVLQKPTPAPDPIPAPPATEELPEEDPDTSEQLDVVTLDDVTDFSAGPYWGVPLEDGWDIVRFDEQGFHEFANPAAGCQFLSYQGYGPEGILSTDDRGATEETIMTVLQIGLPWTAATAEPSVTTDGSLEVPVDWTYNVEMQRLITTYPTVDGDRQRQMVLRNFMPNNLVLYAEVDCPATVAGDEAAQVILDGLGITVY